jgi:hypothetical protein
MNTIRKRFKLLSDLTQFIGINKDIINSIPDYKEGINDKLIVSSL